MATSTEGSAAHVRWGHGHERIPADDSPFVGMPEYGITRDSAAHRAACWLAAEWSAVGGQPSWDVRGRFPPEVRALAEDIWRGKAE